MQRLGLWLERCGGEEVWRACGLRQGQRRAKGALLRKVAKALAEGASRDDPVSAWWVPGRVEVLGKHTDYAGGRSLTSGLEWGMVLAGRPRTDGCVRIRDLARQVSCRFRISPGLECRRGSWTLYPRTVARRLARDFAGRRGGAEIVLAGDLPSAAGLSSSSVLVVGIALLLADLLDLRSHPHGDVWDDPLHCAEYLAAVESGQPYHGLSGDRGVGTRGGSQDHVAILDSRAGHISEYSYRPARMHRRLALPEGYLWAIASSGVKAPKTGSARPLYNRLSDLAAEAVALWNRETDRRDPHLSAVLAQGPDAEARLRDVLQSASTESSSCSSERPARRFPPEDLLRRLEHLRLEGSIIEALSEVLDKQGEGAALPSLGTRDLPPASPAAPAAATDGPSHSRAAFIRADSLHQLGSLVDRSQRGAQELLQNQVPETVHLARSARRLGAAAASAFGAGFGGAVWALMEADRADSFLRAWEEDYNSTFPTRRPTFLTSAPSGPATRLNSP